MEKELLNELLSKFDVSEDAFLVIPIISKKNTAATEPVAKKSSKKEEDVIVESAVSREDVRQALLNAKKAGVKVKDIMSKYVPDGKDSKFDNVPVSAYSSLMKEIADYAV